MIKTFRISPPHHRCHSAGLAMLFVLAVPLTAHADAKLFLSSGGAKLGESAKLCVSMAGGAGQVAGLQANLSWDDTCMTPTDARRLCRADPATGKNVQSALQGRGMLKAILISFSDVNPIPDGNLFCCDFTAVGAEGARCPPVQIQQIIGSTSNGTRINSIGAGNTGVFTVLGPTGDQGGPATGTGSSGPDTGAGEAPPPVAEFAPPGAVAEGPTGGSAPAEGSSSGQGGPLGGNAKTGLPGLPAQPPAAGQPQAPSQVDTNVRKPAEIIEAPEAGLPQVGEPAGEVENLGGAGPTTIVDTPTPGLPTATEAPKTPATPTKAQDTPTPIPPTNTPTPESGWLGGCEMRIPG